MFAILAFLAISAILLLPFALIGGSFNDGRG